MDRSKEALTGFLDYLADKGLMARATAQARKAAASQILSVLEPDEAADVTTIDVDDVVARFHRLHGKRYTPDSLATYRGRLRAAIEDFKAYQANPLAFRPAVQNRERSKAKAAKDQDGLAVSNENRSEPRPAVAPLASSSILPIPIRADLTIFIQGLPYDLTESEARKIAGVVTAMAQP